MIGYGQFQPTSPTQRLGFRFDITGLNRTSFNYTVNNYDVITFLLHYNYMAVQQEETTFYLAMEQLTCALLYIQSPPPTTLPTHLLFSVINWLKWPTPRTTPFQHTWLTRSQLSSSL
jgi:hypothetical protein